MMIFGILFQIFLLGQGLPVVANQAGTMTGVVTSESGSPAAGVRVGAMVQPEDPSDVVGAASLASIAETDELGRFRLENVPQGRYYVTAGRVENPTYYPGTMEIRSAKIVSVTAGTTVAAVNFTIKDISDRGVETVNAAVRIPIQVHTDSDVKIPVFSEHGKVVVRLTSVSDGKVADAPLGGAHVTLPFATMEYRVSVENLPEGYVLRGLAFGDTNLMNGTLKVGLDNFPKPAAGEKMALTPSQSGVLIQRRISSATQTSQIPGSSPPAVVAGSVTSNSDLSVVLGTTVVPTSKISGVRIRGKVENAGQQELYLSGMPGILFNDGSFEFRNVPAGRYLVAMFDGGASTRQRGTVVTAGNRDVDDVELQDTVVLPSDVLSSGKIPESAQMTHSVRGHVVDAATQRPVAGIVTLRGYSRSITNSLPADGEFEIPNLLPGTYNLKVETFERGVLTQSFTVGSDDLDLNLAVR